MITNGEPCALRGARTVREGVGTAGLPHTMQRYLQQDLLRRKDLSHFDNWASIFGETVTAIELAPEGTGYRARTRFARFFNLPELMAMFKETADIKTADQLNLPTPEVEYHVEKAEPTEQQKALVKELSDRAAVVHTGRVDPKVDNMLKITNDGRKLGLDQRLINSNFPDDPGSKLNMCVSNILQIWRDGQTDKLTQLVFCDLSVPKGKAAATQDKTAMAAGDKTAGGAELHALDNLLDLTPDAPFSVYEDIRDKLIAGGIPPEQIAFIHDASTEAKKKELFAKVRAGQVRVLMGSTFKMGAGMNVQDRLVALHDLDCPWRPGDLEQRKGRIVRQGNRGQNYQPDFVIETEKMIYMVEVKGEDKLTDPDVLAKKERGIEYCAVVSRWGKATGYKEWRYVFIPSKQIQPYSTFAQLAERFTVV